MNENEHMQDELREQSPEEQHVTEEAPEERSMGAVLGSIIIVIILLVAAFYLWANRPETSPAIDEPTISAEEVLSEEDPQTQQLQTQSQSDDLAAIEQDLNNTELDNLTKELENIDQELGL